VSPAGRPRGEGLPLSSHILKSRSRGETGFTLIELLVVVAIIPLVVGAISVGLLTILRNQDTTSNNVSASQDTTVVSANFVQDVQGAAMITTNSSVTGPPPCGPVAAAAVPLPAQPIFSLQWTTGATLQVVSYDVQPWGSGYRLVRYLCVGGTTAPTTERVLSRDVQSGLVPAITGSSCSGLSCNPSASAAASAGWAPTAGISRVQLAVATQTTGTTYNYTLIGVPRVSSSVSRCYGSTTCASSPGHPTALSLASLGTNVSCNGNGGLSVAGTLAIDSNSAIVASTNGNGSISADSISTNSTSATALHGDFTPKTPTLSPVTVPDPYAGLAPPVTGLMTASLNPGTPYQGLNVYGPGASYSGPGIYTDTLTFTGGTTTFASGVYVLMNGISVSGNATLVTATTGGVDGKGGVLLYVYRGSVSVTGNGAFGNGPLQPFAPFDYAPTTYANAPSPWPEVVIWQDGPGTQGINDPGDSNDLGLAGNGSASLINGTVYAPSATAGSTGNGDLTVGSVVAAGIGCGGNGAVTIG
jgi:prepilin-type N-terminal cleavage/methylation domain-containing protein